MPRDYEVVWDGRGDLTEGLERDYGAMSDESWDPIYVPPPVVAPYTWLKRYGRDEDGEVNNGVETQFVNAKVYESHLFEGLRARPDALAKAMNLMFQRVPIHLVAADSGLNMQDALRLRARLMARPEPQEAFQCLKNYRKAEDRWARATATTAARLSVLS